ncbi:MAG: hypothetical protein JRJ45_11925 [Deltaproteobacteria bacterium]|nr:hypothetical protein [Deltaproteobacteria bacterium]
MLKYRGDLQSISKAKVADLERIPGISHVLAKNIFEYFNLKRP